MLTMKKTGKLSTMLNLKPWMSYWKNSAELRSLYSMNSTMTAKEFNAFLDNPFRFWGLGLARLKPQLSLTGLMLEWCPSSLDIMLQWGMVSTYKDLVITLFGSEYLGIWSTISRRLLVFTVKGRKVSLSL